LLRAQKRAARAALRLQGLSAQEIADREHGGDSGVTDAEAEAGRRTALADLALLKHEFMLAWERSQLPETYIRNGQVFEVSHRDGDPRFLYGAMACVKLEADLLGLSQERVVVTSEHPVTQFLIHKPELKLVEEKVWDEAV